METNLNWKARLKRLLEINEIKRPASVLYAYVRRYKGLYFELLFLMITSIVMNLSFAWFLQQVTDAAVLGNITRIKQLFLFGVLLIFIIGAVNYLNAYVGATAVQQVKRDMKNDLYHHMLRLPSRYYGNHHSGELVSHLTNDVGNVDGAIGGNLLNMLRLPLMAVAAFIYLLNINWQLSLLCILLVPIAAVSGAIFGKLLRRKSRAIQDYLSKIQVFLNDSFAAHTVIRSFTLEKSFYKKYSHKTGELLNMELKLARLGGWFQAGAGAAGSMAFFLSMGLGAFFVANGVMTVGSLLAFVSLMQYLISPLTGLASLWGSFQRSMSSVERIVKVMDEPAEAKSLPEAGEGATDQTGPDFRTPKAIRSIRFHDVTFGYDERKPVFEGFHLSVPPGKVVALVGPSGAGKSTLFHLVQSFYKPTRGQIYYDEYGIDAFQPTELRRHIAYVPQDTYLFSGTVRENIAYGKIGASEEEIVQAAQAANAHEFIMAMPVGYDTEVGERGVKLSGGQRQRIAIARAVLKDAPILLLDEATSALDGETEHLVQQALERLMAGRTTMVIAHRLTTIQKADWIVVLEQGKIVEAGTHEELMAKEDVYYRMYSRQFEESGEDPQRSFSLGSAVPG